MRISIRRSGEVMVTYPRSVREAVARDFVQSKLPWIREKLSRVTPRGESLFATVHAPAERTQLSASARALVHSRLEHFNQQYGFRWNRVTIRNQATRWGSCSSQGNLSFNYRIALLPTELADYVIVHELCHLRELNHSPRFWALVGQALPDYATLKSRLRSRELG